MLRSTIQINPHQPINLIIRISLPCPNLNYTI